MKKIFYVVIFALISMFLISCDKYSFSLEITKMVGVRKAIIVEYKIVDPEEELLDSQITAVIYENGKTEVNELPVVYDDKGDLTDKITFQELKSGTNYTVKFFAGYDGKKIELDSSSKSTKTEGTIEEPYRISSLSEFKELVPNDPDGHFILNEDIDFAGKSIAPLFTSKKPFRGTFNGNNHTIKGFTIGSEELYFTVGADYKYYGLFGYIDEDAKVFDLNLESITMYVTRNASANYGILAGYNAGSIENVDVTSSTLDVKITGTTEDGYFVGGLVGTNTLGGSIKGCQVAADVIVKAKRNVVVGGVCATNADSSDYSNTNVISDCSFTGNIDVNVDGSLSKAESYKAETIIGGVIGRNLQTVINCSSVGNIKASVNFEAPKYSTYRVSVGGVVGYNLGDGAVLKDCSASVSIEATSYNAMNLNVGYIAGENGRVSTSPYAKIINCTYTLPTEGTIVLNVLDVEAGKEYWTCGLVGVERVYLTGDLPYSTGDTVTPTINKKTIAEDTPTTPEEE